MMTLLYVIDMLSNYFAITCFVEEGGGEKSETVKTEVEKLKSKKISLVAEYYSLGGPRLPFGQEAIMVVCDICGVFLNASDRDDFFANHVKAKMHSNVVAVREKIHQLQV